MIRLLLILTSLIVMAAGETQAAPGDFLFATPNGYFFSRPTGVAVDGSGNYYVTDTGNNHIQKFDSSGKLLLQWGSGGSGNGQFAGPYHIAVDAAGYLYVTDQGNNRVQKFDGNGGFVAQWGGSGSAIGQFNTPKGIAVDSSGNVYVTDWGNARIQKFTSSGTFLAQWGTFGTENGQFKYPGDVAIDPNGKVFVVDQGNYRIQYFDGNGIYLGQWGSRGSGPEQFSLNPTTLAIDGNGDVYVLTGTGVTIFSNSGNYQRSWGEYGSGRPNGPQPGEFNGPLGIAIDRAGKVVVADTGNQRIQIFTATGDFVAEWDSGGSAAGFFTSPLDVAVDLNGDLYVTDTYHARVQKLDSAGRFLLEYQYLSFPIGIAVNRSGEVYVSDNDSNMIYQFGSDLTLQNRWGGYGPLDGMFASNVGLAVAPNGNVYVADSLKSIIQEFDPNGQFIAKFGERGIGNGKFSQPRAVGIDYFGNIYVVDSGNNNIQKFDSNNNFLLEWATSNPKGVSADLCGNVYVSGNGGIQVFDTSGTLLGSFGTAGNADRQMWAPQGVSVTPAGNKVYVADAGSNRVEAFVGFGVTHFGVSVQQPVTTGTAVSFEVTALNDAGTVVSGYSGTVHFTSSDPKATLPSDAVLTKGKGSFSATFWTPGSQSITVGDTLTPSVTGSSGSLTVSGGGGPDQTPFTIWAANATPTVPDSGPDSAVELGVRFRVDLDGYLTGIRFYKGAGNTGTHIGNLWDSSGQLLATVTFTNETASGWQQVSFPYPIPIKAKDIYVASYHTDVGHYSADEQFFARPLADTPPMHVLAGVYAYGTASSFPSESWNNTNYWVDVTFTPMTSVKTIWSHGAVPGVADSGPDSSVELGVRFRSDVDGYVTGIRFYKGAGNTGSHVGKLWDSSGHLLGYANFSETASGWQQANFSSPVAIRANEVYVASYHSDFGHYSADEQFFANTWQDTPPLHALGSVYAYAYNSASNFPTQSWNNANYWVDVAFSPMTEVKSIWGQDAVPSVADSGPDDPVELGVTFKADAAGFVTGVRFFKGAGNTDFHAGNLWDSSGNVLGTAFFTDETALGWQQAAFPSSIPIAANTVYTISYHTNVGHYSTDEQYFAAKGFDAPPLHALADGITYFGGVFAYGPSRSRFPTQHWNSTNYYVDVIFQQ